MKKLLISLLAIVSLFISPAFILSGQAAAVNVFQPCSNGAGSSSVCQDAQKQGNSSSNPVITIIKIVIQILAVVIGVTSIIIIIISGLRMISSSGDSQAISAARNGLIYALVGIVIAVSAQGFVAFVLNRIQ